ncbi:hypothetical protein E0H22_02550 [Rhodopseudomonas boonkerdii]|uniref:hypothetical protein n=1 Tax=Rhodopseudomonas boonkerdii TaxID=475937 RepID=UPI001E4C2323|nr:hypothetical protein [Rhodopseudomonas boonkerdii]UGV24660.1 hypothetical protein E0H22_02550 [Rhodopseudomonas boonkerdii]
MLRNAIFLSAILTSAVVFSAAANAGSTITDKSYWPNEARRSAQSRVATRPDPNSALAYDGASLAGPSDAADRAPTSWRYHGGPKGR